MSDQIVIRKKVIKRTLAIVGVVALIALTCMGCVVALLYFDGKPEPIRELKTQGKTFVLTCADTLDGASYLKLYECRDKFDESCMIIGDYASVTINCSGELTLRENGRTIEVVEAHHAGYRAPDGTWVDQSTQEPLIIYGPH